MLRSWNDGAVLLHGDGPVREPEVLHEPANREPIRDGLVLAVHGELHGSKKDGRGRPRRVKRLNVAPDDCRALERSIA